MSQHSVLNDQFFMKWARDVSTASTCAKIQVGAILVKDTRVLSIGYNGVLSGVKHCTEHFSGLLSRDVLGEPEFLKQHKIFSEEGEFHAESNCLTFAWNNGVETEGAILYCTHCPCFSCAKLIIQAKIARVFYVEPYDNRTVDFLQSNWISCERSPIYL